MTVDRAIRIAHTFMDQDRNDWRDLRDEIAHDVLEKGFKTDVGSFTAAYDGTDLDAAALYVGLSGLLPPHDPRFEGTVAAVEQHLLKGPVVYRYVEDDGLPGREGGFLYCTSWLISAYLLQGKLAEARDLFQKMLGLAGHTGLMSEEFDPEELLTLGNFPQAYSHIGVIENAVALAKAASR
jgi:trehalose 6-phosphate phosphatase